MTTTTTKKPEISELSYKPFVQPLLTARQLGGLFDEVDTRDVYSFTERFQSKTDILHATHYTLKDLINAIENSNNRFEQYPLDLRSVKRIARSIFLEDMWLKVDPIVAIYKDNAYVVSGRHRITAVATVFAQLAQDNSTEEGAREDLFQEYLKQKVRVMEYVIVDANDLVKLVMAHNGSRTMRKSESSHLRVQQLGADASTPDSVANAIVGTEMSPKEAKEIAAQVFTRKPSDKIKPQTRQLMGEKIAAFVLFGVEPHERLTLKHELKITKADEIVKHMTFAWDILNALINSQGIVVIARNISPLIVDAINQMKQLLETEEELPNTLNIVPETNSNSDNSDNNNGHYKGEVQS